LAPQGLTRVLCHWRQTGWRTPKQRRTRDWRELAEGNKINIGVAPAATVPASLEPTGSGSVLAAAGVRFKFSVASETTRHPGMPCRCARSVCR
jgi:hypothetical protein